LVNFVIVLFILSWFVSKSKSIDKFMVFLDKDIN